MLEKLSKAHSFLNIEDYDIERDIVMERERTKSANEEEVQDL